MYIYIYYCIYIHISSALYVHAYADNYIHTCRNTDVSIYIYTYTHSYMHTHTYVKKHMYHFALRRHLQEQEGYEVYDVFEKGRERVFAPIRLWTEEPSRVVHGGPKSEGCHREAAG